MPTPSADVLPQHDNTQDVSELMATHHVIVPVFAYLDYRPMATIHVYGGERTGVWWRAYTCTLAIGQ